MDNISNKPVIHVLGGGPSGLSAAFHLTSPVTNPDWRSRYEVVIHQLGWRLGGKGATARNPAAGYRVEEHGIHLFGNMYANSLHMMKQAFDELDDHRTMETEFLPSDFQVLTDFFEGGWHGFSGGLPHNGEDPWEHDVIADIGGLEESFLSTVKGILSGQELPLAGSSQPESVPDSWIESAWKFIAHFGSESLTTVMEDVSRQLDSALEKEATLNPAKTLQLLERMVEMVDRGMHEIDGGSIRLRWIYVQLDLLAAILRSVVNDNLLSRGIDSLDALDYRDWLRKNGASDLTMSSSLLEAIPNTCMSYPDGDSTDKPKMAASAYLTFILRQILAPGHAAYFFKVGTGDTVILPIYQALVARGVRFEFFHKVHDLVPSADGLRIESIHLEIQASTTSGSYQPLINLPNGELGWPGVPNYDQFEAVLAARLQKVNLESWWADWQGEMTTLQLGPHDQVIVALPPQAQKFSCSSAIAIRPTWAAMVDNIRTAATQALQIWLKESTATLGWRALSGSNRWIGPTFERPIAAFSDFSDTIRSEFWPPDNAPKGLVYFCGPLQDPDSMPGFDDHGFPDRENQRVKNMAAQYLRELGSLLPRSGTNASGVEAIDFDDLYCFNNEHSTGENRVEQQYFRANIDPNERYTLSFPGTLQYRLRAWQSGFTNCALSGDGIYTGFNIGSFEGAVMAGKLASLTLTGSPKLEDIYGYTFLHPGEVGPNTPLMATVVDLRPFDVSVESASGKAQ